MTGSEPSSFGSQPSCEDPVDSLMQVEEARRRLFQTLRPISEQESVALDAAPGRTLAVAIESPVDVPALANSAMDGYALAASSVPTEGTRRLAVIGTSWAGKPFEASVRPGQAVRVFTGAIMPAGLDTVVIQERVQADADSVLIDQHVQPGRNVRLAGEDVQRGEPVLAAGCRLGAAEIGVLASLGIDRVSVVRRLRVAFFTTGDELRSLDEHAGQPLPAGTLFDSNRHTLRAMLQGPGIEAIDLGIVPDEAEHTRKILLQAAEQADVVLSSGGISAGDADHVQQVFHSLGDVAFWKLAMRPGRPLAFGALGDAVFFGLPGNPVAVMVTFLMFVRPALRFLVGATDLLPLSMPAVCDTPLRKSPGRTEFQRGILSRDVSGRLVVTTSGKQGAGRLSSMSRANCLILLAPELDGVVPGQSVEVLPFHGLWPAV